jgi:hypothetical protein
MLSGNDCIGEQHGRLGLGVDGSQDAESMTSTWLRGLQRRGKSYLTVTACSGRGNEGPRRKKEGAIRRNIKAKEHSVATTCEEMRKQEGKLLGVSWFSQLQRLTQFTTEQPTPPIRSCTERRIHFYLHLLFLSPYRDNIDLEEPNPEYTTTVSAQKGRGLCPPKAQEKGGTKQQINSL